MKNYILGSMKKAFDGIFMDDDAAQALAALVVLCMGYLLCKAATPEVAKVSHFYLVAAITYLMKLVPIRRQAWTEWRAALPALVMVIPMGAASFEVNGAYVLVAALNLLAIWEVGKKLGRASGYSAGLEDGSRFRAASK